MKIKNIFVKKYPMLFVFFGAEGGTRSQVRLDSADEQAKTGASPMRLPSADFEFFIWCLVSAIFLIVVNYRHL